MASTIDVELFISEVKQHPEIWDRSKEDNRDKQLRDRAWTDIATKFIDDFDTMNSAEKYELFRKLHCKWRNIRDAFVRGKRRVGESKKGYMYAKQLSFLEGTYNKSIQSNDDAIQKDTDDSWASETEDKMSIKKVIVKTEFDTQNDPISWSDDDDIPIKRKRRNSDVEHNSINRLKHSDASIFVQTNLNQDTNDEDMLFFLSLLPAVRQFNMDQKLEFRTDVLKLIKNYRKDASSSNYIPK